MDTHERSDEYTRVHGYLERPKKTQKTGEEEGEKRGDVQKFCRKTNDCS